MTIEDVAKKEKKIDSNATPLIMSLVDSPKQKSKGMRLKQHLFKYQEDTYIEYQRYLRRAN